MEVKSYSKVLRYQYALPDMMILDDLKFIATVLKAAVVLSLGQRHIIIKQNSRIGQNILVLFKGGTDVALACRNI